MIDKMLLRGAKAHNLKNIDADIPLGKIVGIGVFCVGADALIGPLLALPVLIQLQMNHKNDRPRRRERSLTARRWQ